MPQEDWADAEQVVAQQIMVPGLVSSGMQLPLAQSVPPEQVAPFGSLQFPLPSQIPPWQAVPAWSGAQTPLPAPQVTHGPVQALLQHTPSAQWPVPHWSSWVHGEPCDLSVTQTLPWQNVTPTWQSPSELHPHCPPTQAVPAAFPAQLTPHAPQLLAVDTSVHVPPQQAWP